MLTASIIWSMEKLAAFALMLNPSNPTYMESAPLLIAEFRDIMSFAGERSSTIFATT